MEIKSIKIGGFRNITQTSIFFDKITALIGLNGYGKSNIVDAIDFGIDFISYPSSQKSILMSMKSNIPLLKVNPGADYHFNINFVLISEQKEYDVNYDYSFCWMTDQTPAKIKSEKLRIKSASTKYSTYFSRKNDKAVYKTSLKGRCDKSIIIEDNALLINKLLALDDLFYLDIIKQINSIQFFVERHLDASSSFLPDPFVIKGFQELELQGIQSIPRAIYFLKQEHQDKYELLINAFQKLFPDILELDVKEIKLNSEPKTNIKVSEDTPFIFTNSIYMINIIDSKLTQPVGFEQLSDGTKRVFLMLTYAIIADIKNLSMIAIEEPENSIHPSLLQDYLDILSQLVNKCKIIITSHSPYTVQYLNPSSIYIGLNNDNGSVDFRKIAKSKVKNLMNDINLYGSSLGDYIFSLLSSSDANECVGEYVESEK